MKAPQPKVITAGGAGLTSVPPKQKKSRRRQQHSTDASPPSSSPSSPSSEPPTANGPAVMTAGFPAPSSPALPSHDDAASGTMELISLGDPAPDSDASQKKSQNRTDDWDGLTGGPAGGGGGGSKKKGGYGRVEGEESFHEDDVAKGKKGGDGAPVSPDDLYATASPLPEKDSSNRHRASAAGGTAASTDANTPARNFLWLLICFLGIMVSFVAYGLLLEYATSGGRKLHELSFLFVTSSLYTVTAAAGRHVRDETPTTIPPARFAVLGLTSMGSTFCSVRSLRYVIYPIQVLAKSCKPVPVMIMGTFMGKKYPLKKYINVLLIVSGVALFMGGGDSAGKKKGAGGGDDEGSASQVFGILLLFISLCFDGGTGAYEDKLMSVHSVGPFDLMYNIQLGKTILAGVGLLVLNQVHLFLQMCQDMGFVLVALGLTGAMGQVFIFVTIAKFGALTCSIIGLARKVTTLVASIYFYGHHLNTVQATGLVIAVGSMVLNFWGKGGGGGHGHGGKKSAPSEKHVDAEETQGMLSEKDVTSSERSAYKDDIELGPVKEGTKS
eukprot:CAMPEP_0183303808 /NCGR_PEP_ID=MMETSP0160_2-20130417/9117_1 /TAXON_ID=2839 ORGANISM="Odontella Sinensis, Strain Grunow 1884" /NCGR_SAMPLE_ID=MMETSP0160_2 /ASSEMBLY_ACC=CAM_ASM_000250 /LENGTH=553 /DNA_ID=CAMNT_0025466767 /DNA_START=17 /DNA_END=1678 /DNA_ORIENTATION=-